MAITSFYLLNMFPRMRTLHHHLTINTQHPITKHVPSDAHFTSSPNNHHPSPNSQTCSLGCALYIITQQSSPITQQPNMFPRMRTLHHQPTINTQHPSQTCSLGYALYIITQQSSPITQQPNIFPRMRTLRHHPTVNTHHPTVMTVIQ